LFVFLFSLVNKLVERHFAAQPASVASPVLPIQQAVEMAKSLSVTEINNLLGILNDTKRKLEEEEREVEISVLHDFLSRARQKKQEALERISKELGLLNEDLQTVEARRKLQPTSLSQTSPFLSSPLASLAAITPASASAPRSPPLLPESPGGKPPLAAVVTPPSQHQGGSQPVGPSALKRRKMEGPEKLLGTGPSKHVANLAGSPADRFPVPLDSVSQKKKRVQCHFDDLQSCYFDLRMRGPKPGSLEVFTDNLNKFTKVSRFHLLASLKYGDLNNSSSIVSSIDFDRDCEFFATAGVTKRIKIFEFANVMNEPVDVHYPVREMSCRSKISCLTWNSYIKSQMASSDYEGIVCLWDSYTGQSVQQFEEHQKRAWSVDFCRGDPTRLASGSDDTTVKIWSTNQRNSVGTIESKANICCVKFNPEISHCLAFGSADHNIHYYDLRNAREPLCVFKGHKKAVSYVKFLTKDEVVSAYVPLFTFSSSFFSLFFFSFVFLFFFSWFLRYCGLIVGLFAPFFLSM